MYFLYEATSGYFLFFCSDDFFNSTKLEKNHSFTNNYSKFFEKVKFRAFIPFKTAKHAIENFIFLSKSFGTSFLIDFLINQISIRPQKFLLGIEEPKLANFIYSKYKISTLTNEATTELARGIRLHYVKLTQKFIYSDQIKARHSLAHIFSRSKLNLSLRKADIMIIQSNSLLEQIEKDLNFFSMNVKEWYSWHFPELVKFLNNSYLYVISIKFIGNKKRINFKKAQELGILFMNEKKGLDIFEAIKTSIGSDILALDLLVIEKLCTRVILMTEFKNRLNNYMNQKLRSVVPNLTALLGENLSAKLITKAGSLKNLAKYSSSTIQILGAEKALFKALKRKTKTPKYGLLFNSSFILKVNSNMKGRTSRFLANKCSLAVRIDYFSSLWTDMYGKKLKEQVLDIIKFWQNNRNFPNDMGEI